MEDNLKTHLEKILDQKRPNEYLGARLGNANLSRASLRNAQLADSYIGHSCLFGADVSGATLAGANLCESDLRNANLCYADLRGAYLCGANLYGADLRGADLYEAHLNGANLRSANLRSADLCGANLYGADLRGADLYEAHLNGANLRSADLRGANLYGADLRGADLYEAHLNGANLCSADLRGAKNIPFIPLVCPSSGSFIGWKKAVSQASYIDEVIVKLLIPEDAKRSSSTSDKCRCDKAIVLAIESLDGAPLNDITALSRFDTSFIYEVGEQVSVPDFDDYRWDECSKGIHFFIDRQAAVQYV